jgi:hypothetical protein
MRTLRCFVVVILGLAFLSPIGSAQSQTTSKGTEAPNAPSASVEPIIKFNVEFGAEGRFSSSPT